MAQTTVDGSFITVNTIDSDHYVNGSIDLAHIGANQIDGTKIAIASQAAGDIMYYNGTDWIRLAKGTADQVLTMNDGATAPNWEAAAGGGVDTTGTPASTQVALFTDADTVQGLNSLKFADDGDGSTLTIDGDSSNARIILKTNANSSSNFRIQWTEGSGNGSTGNMSYEFGHVTSSNKFAWYSRAISGLSGSAGSGGNILEVEDGTSEIKIRENSSMPSVTKGIAKAWCQINASNGALASPDYNVTTTGRDSAGVYTVTLTTSMESTPYVVGAWMREPVSYMATVSNFAVGSYKVRGYNTSGTAIDIDISTAVFGEQT